MCLFQFWRKKFTKTPLINQSAMSTVLRVYSGALHFSQLLFNQQTVVYSFLGAKLNKWLQEGYSCKNLQHKFKFCLYLQNGLIKYPPHTYRSLPQHTSHGDFSNVNSTIRILLKIKKISFQSLRWFVIIYIHGCGEYTGTTCSSTVRVPGSSTKALQLPVMKGLHGEQVLRKFSGHKV